MKKLFPLLLAILIIGALLLSACAFPGPNIDNTVSGEQGNGNADGDEGQTNPDSDENNQENNQTNTPDDSTGDDSTGEDGKDEEITASDPYVNIIKDEFYANYTPAKDYMDAYYRTQHGLMSGDIVTPDQAPNVAQSRPTDDGKYIRNTAVKYEDDGNTFILTDANGNKVKEIYKDGAYITLEEVAAYVYAFGNVPANYTSSKKTKPTESIWGEYLRVNNNKFSGDTSKYPYEPVLPRISGCGGDLQYYEIDIGTTGTDCDPSYAICPYNNGTSITRGAARIVYVRFYQNGDHVDNVEERYVFYTYNHYNDFQEYLGYEGGFGDIFGNITGGGVLSDKYDCNPTDYIPTVLGALPSTNTPAASAFVEKDFCDLGEKDDSPLLTFEEVLEKENTKLPFRPGYQISPEAIERYETKQLRKEVLALYEAYVRKLKLEEFREIIKNEHRYQISIERTEEQILRDELRKRQEELIKERLAYVDERISDLLGKDALTAIENFSRTELEQLKSLLELRTTIENEKLFINEFQRPIKELIPAS